MWLIVPDGDMPALGKRIEARFGIRFARHWSEMRGGSYLRWPRTRKSLFERLNPWCKAERPPFSQLLVFWNGEVEEDAEPFVQGYALDTMLIGITGAMGDEARVWFESAEHAVLVRD